MDPGPPAILVLVPEHGGFQRPVFLGELEVDELVDEGQVPGDLPGGMDLEVAGRQSLEMRRDLLFRKRLGEDGLNLFAQQLPVAEFGFDEFSVALQSQGRFLVQGEQQRILEAVPQGVAGAHGVGEGVQGEQVEVFLSLHLGREGADHLRVVEVAALRSLHHGEVVLDDEGKGVGGSAVEPETLGDLQGQLGPHQFMASSGKGLAAIVEQQRQIQDKRALHLVEHVRVAGEGAGFGTPDLIELGDASQRVLIDGVLMIELVLDEVGHLVELGQESTEQTHLVHGPDIGSHIATLVEDLQEGGLVVGIGLEGAIDERNLLPEQLGQVGVDLESAFLGLQEGSENTAPILTQNAPVHHVELPVHDPKPVKLFGRRRAAFGFSALGFACL